MPQNESITMKEADLYPRKSEIKISPKNALTYLAKSGRVAILGTVLTIACSGAEKVAKQTPTEPIPNTPHAQKTITSVSSSTPESTTAKQTEITDPQLAAAKIKTIIESSRAPQDQKDQLLAQFTEQEQARKSLILLEQAYQAEKTNGVPTLLVQTKKLFGNMDISPLLENENQTKQAFYESQIFFLHDLQKINNTFTTAANLPDVNFVDLQTPIQHLPLELNAQVETYANMNTQKEPTVIFEKYQSNSADDIAKNQQEQTRLKAKIDKLPIVSNISVSFGNADNGDFDINKGEAILYPSNNPEDHIDHVVIGHGQDIFADYAMIKSLSAKNIIRLMIARNNAVLDSKVGIQYQDPEKIYSPARESAYRKLNATVKNPDSNITITLDEFGCLISSYPTDYFLGFAQRNVNQDTNPSNPFRILQSPTLLKIAAEEATITTPLIDKTFSGFLQKESADFAQISAENQLTGKLIQRIISKQELYKKRFGDDTQNLNPDFGFLKGETFKTFKRELLPEELTLAVFNNDQDILSLIPHNQLKPILAQIINLAMAANREQQAVGVEWTLNTPRLTLTETGNPYQNYLDLLWEIKNETH